MMNSKTVVISTSVAATTGLIALWAWNKYSTQVKEWKKNKIRDAYYNTITQADIAWG